MLLLILERTGLDVRVVALVLLESLLKEFLETDSLNFVVIFLFDKTLDMKMKTPESPLTMTNIYCWTLPTGMRPVKNPRARILERITKLLMAKLFVKYFSAPVALVYFHQLLDVAQR